MPITSRKPPPPKSPSRFSGGIGRSPRPADGLQRAGHGDIVDVVPGSLGERAVLAPTGHSPVDQPRVARKTLLGTEAEAFGDAGAEALDEHVGGFHQPQHRLDPSWVLQVGLHRALSAVEHPRGHRQTPAAAAGALDPNDVGTEIGQHHAAEGRQGEAGELDHPDARERAKGPCVICVPLWNLFTHRASLAKPSMRSPITLSCTSVVPP